MADLIRVGALSDPRLEPYRAVKDRDLAGRLDRFVAEGDVVVRRLLSPQSLFAAESVLLAEGREEALAPAFAATRPDLPVYVLPRPLMTEIVGFPIHRGILAVARRPDPVPAARLMGDASRSVLLLGLIGLANHDNVGAAFRNAAAFGADAVLLDGTTCDPLYRKAVRVSVGACLTVPFGRAASADALVDALTAAGIEAFALSPSGRESVETVAWPGRAALILGTEGPGLPPRFMGRLRTVRIGMRGGFDSLNVATAAAIALHAVRSRSSGTG